MLDNLFVSVISYLGLFAGVFIAFFTVEELDPGKRYFLLLRRALFMLIVFFSFVALKVDIILSVIVSAASVFLVMEKSYLEYILFAGAIIVSSWNTALMLILGSLIFVYGLPAGSMITLPKKRVRSFVNVLRYAYYPVLACLPLLFAYL